MKDGFVSHWVGLWGQRGCPNGLKGVVVKYQNVTSGHSELKKPEAKAHAIY